MSDATVDAIRDYLKAERERESRPAMEPPFWLTLDAANADRENSRMLSDAILGPSNWSIPRGIGRGLLKLLRAAPLQTIGAGFDKLTPAAGLEDAARWLDEDPAVTEFANSMEGGLVPDMLSEMTYLAPAMAAPGGILARFGAGALLGAGRDEHDPMSAKTTFQSYVSDGRDEADLLDSGEDPLTTERFYDTDNRVARGVGTGANMLYDGLQSVLPWLKGIPMAADTLASQISIEEEMRDRERRARGVEELAARRAASAAGRQTASGVTRRRTAGLFGR